VATGGTPVFGPWFTIRILLATVVPLAFTGFLLYRVFSNVGAQNAQHQRLLQFGIPAQGRILSLSMGGMTMSVGVNRQLQVNVGVEVHRQGMPPYQSMLTTMVSELYIPSIQPGMWVQLRVDPMNPHLMTIAGVGPMNTPLQPF
jgi:hypothetical protein